MRYFLLLAPLLVFLSAACNKRVAGPADEPTTAAPTNRTARVGKVLRSIAANATAAEWMDGRAKIKVESDRFSVGGTAYIRLHRDEAIWMSVKKFGIEGARVLIRPDSFFLVNRLKDDYVAEPLSYLEEKYKVPARFDLLQEIVLGNAAFLTDQLEVANAGAELRLTGRDRDFATDYRVGATDYRLRSMEVRDLRQARTLAVSNGDYRAADGLEQRFPHRREIRVDGGSEGTASLDMEFTKLTFGERVTMPFSRR